MIPKITKSIVYTVIFIMAFECLTSAFVRPEHENGCYHVSVSAKSSSTSFLSLILFEGIEEEERIEEESTKILAIELADLGTIRNLLSIFHTHSVSFIHPDEQHFELQPPLFKRFCVFII